MANLIFFALLFIHLVTASQKILALAVKNIQASLIFLARLLVSLQSKCIIMDNISDKQDVRQQEVQQPRRKQFHGFSMGFLLILLAVVVGVYIICTVIAGGS